MGWVRQPGRPQSTPLTEAERKRLEIDPYESLEDAAPPAPDPPTKQPQVTPIISAHLQMTEEELNDPYGLKAEWAARESAIQEALDDEDPPGAPQPKE